MRSPTVRKHAITRETKTLASAGSMSQEARGDDVKVRTPFSVDAPDIIVEAVKQAESSDDLIVRSYETNGQESRATLTFAFAHTQWTGTYHPFEIKTLRIDRRTGKVKEVNALEE